MDTEDIFVRLYDFRVNNETNEEEDSDNEESQYTDRTQFIIQMFGYDDHNQSCSITVKDFKPYFYIKVGDAWTKDTKMRFLNFIKAKIGKYYQNSIADCKLLKKKKLYGFDGGKKYKFIELRFNSLLSFNKCKNLWYDSYSKRLYENGISFEDDNLYLYEANIPPLLRLFHIKNISPSGWIKFSSSQLLPCSNTTSCAKEYEIGWKSINSHNSKETQVPLKICSFDIEASSSHGDFPLPIKSYKKLASQMIEYTEVVKCVPTEEMMKNIILTAFGFSTNYSSIDLVYPKVAVTKEYILKRFDKWIHSFLRNETTEEVKETIKIEELFEKMNKADEEDVDKKFYKSQLNYKKTKVLELFQKKIDRSLKIEELTISLNTYFPSLEGDKVTFIGSTFMMLGEKQPYKNHCIVLNTCSEVKDVEIESYGTESDVLVAWSNLIQRENPDIIIGYNIFGFDYEFMFRRAQENQCVPEFLKLSKINDEICGTNKDGKYEIEETSIHIASGQHDLKYIKMNGRIQIDLYNFFRREENLTSYKLDFVAGHFIGDFVLQKSYDMENNLTMIQTTNLTGLLIGSYIHFEEIGHSIDYYNNGEKFIIVSLDSLKSQFTIQGEIIQSEEKKLRWCLAKDDVTPKDIFRLTNGSADDRAIIAKYCIQDCNLVHYLLNKVDVWTGISEMASICSVPINFIILRGQGIKLMSYVAKKCREKETLIPVIEKSFDDEGFEGAIVLEPKCDLYMDNPVACVDYASLYPSSMMSENISHDSKVWTKEYDLNGNLINISGNMKYDNLPDYEYVDITFDVFKYERKSETSAAEKIKTGIKTCRFAQAKTGLRAVMPSILEELLLARKATRKLIPLQTDNFMKNVLDKRQLGYKLTANSLYGQCGAKTSAFYEKDCAASTTAVGRMLLTYAKKVIEQCYGNKICNTLHHGPVLTKAEYIYGDSVANYTPIYISYISTNGVQIVEIIRIDELIHKFGNGKWEQCSEIGRQDKEYYVFEIPIYTWSDSGWTLIQNIIRHELSPNKKMVRILTYNGLVDVTDDHSLLRPDGTEVTPNEVTIGSELMHHKLNIRQHPMDWINTIPFFKEYYDKNIKIQILKNWLGERTQFILNKDTIKVLGMKIKSNYFQFDYNQELINEIYICVTQLFNFDVSIEIDCSLTIDLNARHSSKMYHYDTDKNKIISKIDLEYDGYVYDLTTENHHFAAGIGDIIVHNTDSVFFTFNLQTPEGEQIRGKKALEITIELAQEAGHLASSFLKQPHDLEYEKTFMPFCLLSKKRYVGMLYETDVEKCKRKEMGIVLKRRDNAPIVKDIYGGIIDILMKKQNIEEAIQFLRISLRNIIDRTYPISKFIISKSLRSGYKNPQQIAHKVLADRITQREPGNKPQSGDRIPYIYIHNNSKTALQGEKIETPLFIQEHNLKIDYSHYITNQIMKPVQQVFALVLEKIWMKQNKKTKVNNFHKECLKIRKEYEDDEKYQLKIEALKNKEIKILLFDEFLRETNNSKENNKMLTQFFASK
jgi:DNA polymerase elongation subunit (family B)